MTSTRDERLDRLAELLERGKIALNVSTHVEYAAKTGLKESAIKNWIHSRGDRAIDTEGIAASKLEKVGQPLGMSTQDVLDYVRGNTPRMGQT